ncbi:MAG: glycerol kinase GlpK, partial [bacterium]|nr:glycerol kinase GlpK [bacterium]
MKPNYILAIDQGTTGTRGMLIHQSGKIIASAYREFNQSYPQPGWVEHDPREIWNSTVTVIQETLNKSRIKPTQIAGIGIANQRETTVLWERKTGNPVYNAIVWQCRRTAAFCEKLKRDGWSDKIQQKTGLIIDAYFSGTKIKWILDNVPSARKKAERGELCFGTIDSWLIWNLTSGITHSTDYTNASRTMVFNLKTLTWDAEILKKLTIPKSILPEVKKSAAIYGYTAKIAGLPAGIPISGVVGDQQAALFGQGSFAPGTAKNTYGTGCFLLFNLGKKLRYSKNGLITTIACGKNGEPVYALEGSVFIAGAAIQWLRDGLELIQSAEETERYATSVSDTHGVYLVPAFAGLGAPYWDMDARGGIFGLTRGVTKSHLIRATLESIAYQTKDLLEAVYADAKIRLQKLQVDGGTTRNNFLMQFQSDILNLPLERPQDTETTALGAAYLAGLGVGFWTPEQIEKIAGKNSTRFIPKMTKHHRDKLYTG